MMTWKRSRTWPCVLMVVIGCTDPGNTTLAAYPDASVRVHVGTVGFPEHAVEISSDAFLDAFPDCPIADASLAATFRGRPMRVIDRGGKDEGDCRPFRFLIDADQPFAGTAIEIRDDSGAVTAVFTEDALTPRQAILRSHPSWTFRVGDTVRWDWSPASDLATATASVSLGIDDYPASIVDGQLELVIPSTDATHAIVFVRPVPAAVATSCENAARCIAGHDDFFHHDVVITR